jgi:FtsZ-interacting cell division protein YlmF
VVLRVNVFADAREVAETLMAGVPVLLDLTGAENEVAKRVLDFSTGVVFGLASGMHRVDRNVFLLTPADTEVTELMESAGLSGG